MTLSDEDLTECYIHTLNQCGLFFLHPSNLERLHASGFIDRETMRKSSELRGKVVSLQENGEWNMQAFRSSPNWPEVLRLCDEIKSSNSVWPHPRNG
ncbi:hypothetical protein [Saccharibacillus sacchari]|uniref:hypothetical protein n=1 Tax=Saccharibacillus sacchari TaxID=456493 RepID=UPI0004B6D0E6|nr:hypothetical protein [Saccharibacillus sacchari]